MVNNIFKVILNWVSFRDNKNFFGNIVSYLYKWIKKNCATEEKSANDYKLFALVQKFVQKQIPVYE